MTDETIYEAILLFYCIKLETVKKQVKANVINPFNITLQCNVDFFVSSTFVVAIDRCRRRTWTMRGLIVILLVGNRYPNCIIIIV